MYDSVLRIYDQKLKYLIASTTRWISPAHGGVYARQQQGTGEGAAANIATYLIYFRITNLN